MRKKSSQRVPFLPLCVLRSERADASNSAAAFFLHGRDAPTGTHNHHSHPSRCTVGFFPTQRCFHFLPSLSILGIFCVVQDSRDLFGFRMARCDATRNLVVVSVDASSSSASLIFHHPGASRVSLSLSLSHTLSVSISHSHSHSHSHSI